MHSKLSPKHFLYIKRLPCTPLYILPYTPLYVFPRTPLYILPWAPLYVFLCTPLYILPYTPLYLPLTTDNWNSTGGNALEWVTRWIRSHQDAARALNKPLVLSEVWWGWCVWDMVYRDGGVQGVVQ